MPQPFDKINPSEIEFKGKQPQMNFEIHGVESQVIMDVFAEIPAFRKTHELPSKPMARIEWGQKAFAGAVMSLAILFELAEEGKFAVKNTEEL